MDLRPRMLAVAVAVAASAPMLVSVVADVPTSTTARSALDRAPAVVTSSPPPRREQARRPPATSADKGMAIGWWDIGWPATVSDAELERRLRDLRSAGVTWIRTDIYWFQVQEHGRNSFNWAPFVRFLNAATRQRIRVLPILNGSPAWARAPGCDSERCYAADPRDYGRFAAAAARRFPRIQAWELWNEPNLAPTAAVGANPEAYTAMLRAASRSVRRVNPRAYIVSAGLAPANTGGGDVNPVDWVRRMYAAGGGPHVDAIGWHPYCWHDDFDCPRAYAEWSTWSRIADTPRNLRAVMKAHGDGSKPIWLTEFGAPTAGGRGDVSPARQARMVRESYALVRQRSYFGPLFWYSYRDRHTGAADTEANFGLRTSTGAAKPGWKAFRAVRGRASARVVTPRGRAPGPWTARHVRRP